MPDADAPRRVRPIMQIPRQQERRYSDTLAFALHFMDELLQHAQPDPRLHALKKEVRHFHEQRLCPTQRIQTSYVLAHTSADDGEPQVALAYLDIARMLAREHGDFPSLIQVERITGFIYQSYGNLDAACEAFMTALSMLHLLSHDGPLGHADANMEMELLQRLVGCLAELGEIPESLAYQQTAQTLLATVASVRNDPARGASFLWNDAMLSSWSYAPVRALQQAGAVITAYHHIPPTPRVKRNIGRLHAMRAEYKLDVLAISQALTTEAHAHTPSQRARLMDISTSQQELLKRFVKQESYTPQKLLQSAYLDVHDAQTIALTSADSVGGLLADMMGVRCDLLAKQMGLRPKIWNYTVQQARIVADEAKRIGDAPLIGRTENLLADALLAAGRYDEARSHYMGACAVLTEYDYHAQAFAPRATFQAMQAMGY